MHSDTATPRGASLALGEQLGSAVTVSRPGECASPRVLECPSGAQFTGNPAKQPAGTDHLPTSQLLPTMSSRPLPTPPARGEAKKALLESQVPAQHGSRPCRLEQVTPPLTACFFSSGYTKGGCPVWLQHQRDTLVLRRVAFSHPRGVGCDTPLWH